MKIFGDGLGGGFAVIAFEEFFDERAVVLLGIPHELGEDPGAEFGKFGAVTGVSAFGEKAFHIMALENADVGAEDKPVWMRMDVVAEIGAVIPDVEAGTDFGPAVEVGHEGGIGRMIERFTEVAFDRAEADDDIGERMKGFGRLTRELVGEGVYGDLGEFWSDFFGDIVDEGKHGSGVAAFGIVERFAIGTFTPASPVVLGDGNDLGVGRFAQPFADALDGKVAQLWIREAKLGAFVRAFAFDKAVPFGMFGEMFLGRNQRIKGVSETFVENTTAEFFGDGPSLVVGAVMNFPVCFEAGIPIRAAIFEGRFFTNVGVGDLEGWFLRNVCGPGSPPANAALLAQETIHGVDRATRTPASEEKCFTFDPHYEFLGPEGGEIDFGKFFFGERAGADDDGRVRGFGQRVGDLEFSAGDLVKGVCEFVKGGLFWFGGTGLGDDDATRFAIFGDCEAGVQRGGRNEERSAGQKGQGGFNGKHGRIFLGVQRKDAREFGRRDYLTTKH